jgi:hypothetical protein
MFFIVTNPLFSNVRVVKKEIYFYAENGRGDQEYNIGIINLASKYINSVIPRLDRGIQSFQ